jgi:exosome complex component RRP43
LVPNIELQTGCSPDYLPGQPPSTLAQSLSTRIYALLHESRFVDGEGLRIWYTPPDMRDVERMRDDDEEEEEIEAPEAEVKAFWTLYIDMLFISLDGNAFDAAWTAVVSALRDVRLPTAYWDADREMILCDDAISSSKRLQLNGSPVAVTALVFKEKEQGGVRETKKWLLVDPDAFEEDLCDESVTVVVDRSQGKTQLLGISKSGGTVVGQNEIRDVVSLAEERWNTLSQILKT